MGKKKKVMSKKKKIIIGIIVGVVLLVVLAGLTIYGLGMTYLGYFNAGNKSEYDVSKIETVEDSPLEGMNIAFLGSSVTDGVRAKGVSFVEYLAARNNFTYTKEAVSGTTLVDGGEDSYVQRMINNLDPSENYDLFVCQLSTNDAKNELPMGTISETMNLEDFDTSTVIGAMEYIICYAKDTWNCPVVFYTGTEYESTQYKEMINALYELQDKWRIQIVDLWNELDPNIDEYDLYMADEIHPTRAGYRLWWTPQMEEDLYKIVDGNNKTE